MRGQGLLRQITDRGTRYYESLTLETLNKFMRELQAQSKPRDLVIPLGDFMSRVFTATATNNTDELAKLALESLQARIIDYKNKAYYMQIPYDLVYMLSSTFDLKITFDKDVVWGVTTEYHNENEYDDSYTATQLSWRDGKWFLETYYSEGAYSYDKMETREISVNEVFQLIVNE
jgi:hypothetical protein